MSQISTGASAPVTSSPFQPAVDQSTVSHLRIAVKSVRPCRGGVVASVVSGNIRFSVAIPDGLSVQPGDSLIVEFRKGGNPFTDPCTAIYPANQKPVRKESTMNELIQITGQSISGQTVQTVNARELHAFLEVKIRFNDWIKKRIEQYGFKEGIDYVKFELEAGMKMSENGGEIGGIANTQKNVALESMGYPSFGQQGRIEYGLTLNMGKELSMVERNERGRQARQYFIECERKAKNPDPAAALADPAFLRSTLLSYTEKVIALESKLEEQAPKIAALDRIEASKADRTLTQAAKELDVKRDQLIKRLHAEGWIYRQNCSWVARAEAIRSGRLVYKEAHFTNDKTEMQEVRPYCHLTPKGLVEVAEMLGRNPS